MKCNNVKRCAMRCDAMRSDTMITWYCFNNAIDVTPCIYNTKYGVTLSLVQIASLLRLRTFLWDKNKKNASCCFMFSSSSRNERGAERTQKKTKNDQQHVVKLQEGGRGEQRQKRQGTKKNPKRCAGCITYTAVSMTLILMMRGTHASVFFSVRGRSEHLHFTSAVLARQSAMAAVMAQQWWSVYQRRRYM